MDESIEFIPSAPLLIMAEDASINSVYRVMLKEYRHRFPDIIECHSVEDATAALNGLHPICCVLDFDSSWEQSLDFLVQRRMNRSEHPVPILAVTSETSPERLVNLLEAGAHEYLIQGEFDASNLVKSINTAVRISRLQSQVYELTHYDPLTGLLNRSLFIDRVKRAMEDFQRYGRQSALIFIDLDHFKSINDTYGHDIGDRLLQEVADRIRRTCRKSDQCGRLAGDEFVVLLPEVDEEGAYLVAQKLLDVLSVPIEVNILSLSVTPSLGVAHCPTTSETAQDLLLHADSALYLAKEKGRSQFQQFNRLNKQRFERSQKLKQALPGAIANNELELAYQLVFATRSARVVGMEALCRWPHQIYQVEAREIMAWVQELGLGFPFHQWLLKSLFSRQTMKLMERNVDLLCLNFSLKQLVAPEIIELLFASVKQAGLQPCNIELDIDESEIRHLRDSELKALTKLKDAGFQIALDNFGISDVACHRISDLPFDTLKVGQEFNRKVTRFESYRKMVLGFVQFAHAIDKKIIVKGVESERVWHLLCELQCDGAQGYWLSEPEYHLDQLNSYFSEVYTDHWYDTFNTDES